MVQITYAIIYLRYFHEYATHKTKAIGTKPSQELITYELRLDGKNIFTLLRDASKNNTANLLFLANLVNS